jgi:hypothetical protein
MLLGVYRGEIEARLLTRPKREANRLKQAPEGGRLESLSPFLFFKPLMQV